MWLLKNKDLSHWVKLYANNKEANIIGQLKISNSFFRNKTFAQGVVSNLVDFSPEKSYERSLRRDSRSSYCASASRQTSNRNSFIGQDFSMDQFNKRVNNLQERSMTIERSKEVDVFMYDDKSPLRTVERKCPLTESR